MIRASSVGIHPGRRPASLGLAATLAGTVAAGVPTAVTAAAVGRSDAWAGLATTPLASDQTITQNVLLIAYDPLFPDKGNQPLHAVYGWQDPVTLTDGVVSDLEQASHGVVHYNIVKTEVLNEFPRLTDGFVYTESTWEHDYANWSTRYQGARFDWQWFIDSNNILAQIDSGAIDEVWLYQDPLDEDRAYESTMAGPGAYWLNSPPVPGTNGSKAFVIMSWNYQRGVAEAIHSYGHRVENTMCRMYNTCGNPTAVNNWNAFTAIDKTSPGKGAVGNVHYPVNGVSDYDYDNQHYVLSDADAWLNYPDLSAPPQMINATAWSPSGVDPQREYLDWWYAHLPHAAGRNADGLLNDWWQYIIKVDQYKNGDPARVVPSLSSGIAASVVRTGGSFTTTSLVVPRGTYVTVLFRAPQGMFPAGTPVRIWIMTRASETSGQLWYPLTTRLLGSDGTARFYRQIDGWIAIRGHIASTSGSAWSLSRIATART